MLLMIGVTERVSGFWCLVVVVVRRLIWSVVTIMVRIITEGQKLLHSGGRGTWSGGWASEVVETGGE